MTDSESVVPDALAPSPSSSSSTSPEAASNSEPLGSRRSETQRIRLSRNNNRNVSQDGPPIALHERTDPRRLRLNGDNTRHENLGFVPTARQNVLPLENVGAPGGICRKCKAIGDIDSVTVLSVDFADFAKLFKNSDYVFYLDPSLVRVVSNHRSRVKLQTGNTVGCDSDFKPTFGWRRPTYINLEDFPSIKIGSIQGSPKASSFKCLTFDMYLHILPNDLVPPSGYLTERQTLALVAAFEYVARFRNELDSYVENMDDDRFQFSQFTEEEAAEFDHSLANMMCTRKRPEYGTMFKKQRIAPKPLAGILGVRFLEYLEAAIFRLAFDQSGISDDAKKCMKLAINLNLSDEIDIQNLTADFQSIALNKLIECKAVNTKLLYCPQNEQWYKDIFSKEYGLRSDLVSILNTGAFPKMENDAFTLFDPGPSSNDNNNSVQRGRLALKDCSYTSVYVDMGIEIHPLSHDDDIMFFWSRPKVTTYTREILSHEDQHSHQVDKHAPYDQDLVEFPEVQPSAPPPVHQTYKILGCKDLCSSTDPRFYVEIGFEGGHPLIPDQAFRRKVIRIPPSREKLSIQGCQLYHPGLMDGQPYDECKAASAILMSLMMAATGRPSLLDAESLFKTLTQQCMVIKGGIDQLRHKLGDRRSSGIRLELFGVLGIHEDRQPSIHLPTATSKLQELVLCGRKTELADYGERHIRENMGCLLWLNDLFNLKSDFKSTLAKIAGYDPKTNMALLLALQSAGEFVGAFPYGGTLFKKYPGTYDPMVPVQVNTTSRLVIPQSDQMVTGLKYGVDPAVFQLSYLSPRDYNAFVERNPENVLPYTVELLVKARKFSHTKTTLQNFECIWNLITMASHQELRESLWADEEFPGFLFASVANSPGNEHPDGDDNNSTRRNSHAIAVVARGRNNDTQLEIPEELIQQSGNDEDPDPEEELAVRADQRPQSPSRDGDEEDDDPNTVKTSPFHSVNLQGLAKLDHLQQLQLLYLVCISVVRCYDQHWHAYRSHHRYKYPSQQHIYVTDRNVGEDVWSHQYRKPNAMSSAAPVSTVDEMLNLLVGNLDDDKVGSGWMKDGTRFIIRSLLDLVFKVEEVRQKLRNGSSFPKWTKDKLLEMLFMVFGGEVRRNNQRGRPILWVAYETRQIPSDNSFRARHILTMETMEALQETAQLIETGNSREYPYTHTHGVMKKERVTDTWNAQLLVWKGQSLLYLILTRAIMVAMTNMIEDGKISRKRLKLSNSAMSLYHQVMHTDVCGVGINLHTLFFSEQSATSTFYRVLNKLAVSADYHTDANHGMFNHEKLASFSEFTAVCMGDFVAYNNWRQWLLERFISFHNHNQAYSQTKYRRVLHDELEVVQATPEELRSGAPSYGEEPDSLWYAKALRSALEKGVLVEPLIKCMVRDRVKWMESYKDQALLGQVTVQPTAVTELVNARGLRRHETQSALTERYPISSTTALPEHPAYQAHTVARKTRQKVEVKSEVFVPDSHLVDNAEWYIGFIGNVRAKAGYRPRRGEWSIEQYQATLAGFKQFGGLKSNCWVTCKNSNLSVFGDKTPNQIKDAWRTISADRNRVDGKVIKKYAAS